MAIVTPPNIYFKGALVRVGVDATNPFKNASGVTTDPTTVTIKVRDPLGVETDYTGGQLTHDSLGVYSVNVTAGTVGEWWYRIEGSGNLSAIFEHSFFVETTGF